MHAALFIGLAALHAAVRADPPTRAVLEPAPALQLGYERFGPQDTPTPPGLFDGALATPAGTLRTSVRAAPDEEQRFQRGDTTFDLPSPVLSGRLQLREREAGGTAASWRARWGTGLVAEAQGERTPVRAGEALRLQQAFGGGETAQARIANSLTPTAQGSRWDVEFTRATTISRWSAGIEAADRTYVSSWGDLEARAGLHLGTQWLVFPHTRVEARYTRQVRWDEDEPVCTVMLGTRLELPRRLSLVTGVERDTEAGQKATATLTMPLELR